MIAKFLSRMNVSLTRGMSEVTVIIQPNGELSPSRDPWRSRTG